MYFIDDLGTVVLMVAEKIARGSKVTLTRKDNVWLKRTPEELKALRDADIARGRFCDDGGEPILYGTYGGWPGDLQTMEVTVTSLRATWSHWHRKPKSLTTGYCESLGREVLFQR